MSDTQSKLNILLKEVCIRYFYAIIIISSLFAIYYIIEDIKPLKYIVGLCPIIHLLLFAIPYRLNYNSIKPLIPIYLIYLSAFLYANVLYFWPLGQMTAFIWYGIIPVACMIFFNKKTVIAWGIYILVLICSVFIVISYIPIEYSYKPTDDQLIMINMMTIIFSIILIIFFLDYLNRVSVIREMRSSNHDDNVPDNKENEKTELCVIENLHGKILTYFSEQKPYCDSDFTITQLAKDLDTNVKYVSKAIQNYEGVNFRTFVNKYRITLVKELMEKDLHNKYTISYIYSVAGFRNQSTFNKTFKDIEGITPSEYIKKYEIAKFV